MAVESHSLEEQPSGWQISFYRRWAPLLSQMVKNLPAVQETQVWSLGQEDLLEKGMATHSSIVAWRIPWTENPGWLQFGIAELDTTEWLSLFIGNEPRGWSARGSLCVRAIVQRMVSNLCYKEGSMDFSRLWCFFTGGLGSAGWWPWSQGRRWPFSTFGKSLGIFHLSLCLDLPLERTLPENELVSRADQQISWMLVIPEFSCRRSLKVEILWSGS